MGKTKCDLEKTYTHWSENGEVANHYTALHVAAAHNSIKAFEVLLDLNQDWRARLSNQDTCAHLAAQRGHLVILHMLHEKGDKFDVRGIVICKYIMYCLVTGDMKIEDVFLKVNQVEL